MQFRRPITDSVIKVTVIVIDANRRGIVRRFLYPSRIEKPVPHYFSGKSVIHLPLQTTSRLHF